MKSDDRDNNYRKWSQAVKLKNPAISGITNAITIPKKGIRFSVPLTVPNKIAGASPICQNTIVVIADNRAPITKFPAT